ILTRSAPYEKSKFLGSGGSMVARLKLKEIDGRAPPGVNYAFAASSAPDSTTLWVGWWPLNKKTVASPLGGNTLKLRGPPILGLFQASGLNALVAKSIAWVWK